MKKFTIYPAIDLKAGRVVRFQQGNWNRSKTFYENPVEAAEKWISQGAEWLHIINLDGAFGKDSQPNLDALQRILIIGKGALSIQFGGGLRNLEAIQTALSLGVSRVILGTIAVEKPNLVVEALDTFGSERIVLGIDAMDGYMHVAGWKKKTKLTPVELAAGFIDQGLKTIIYTNIRQDGMQQGVDIQSTKQLAESLPVEVIASGGVGGLEDVKAVKKAGLPGVVVGKALYENKFTLSEAIQC